MIDDAAAGLPITPLGWRDDVQNVLSASDAVVLTSDNEGTPLSLIQAGFAGLPVVATDVGSVRDVVVDDETGWLTEPSAASLSSALLAMLSDTAEAQRRGREGLKRAQRLYGVERLASDHAHLYSDIAAARARA